MGGYSPFSHWFHAFSKDLFNKIEQGGIGSRWGEQQTEPQFSEVGEVLLRAAGPSGLWGSVNPCAPVHATLNQPSFRGHSMRTRVNRGFVLGGCGVRWEPQPVKQKAESTGLKATRSSQREEKEGEAGPLDNSWEDSALCFISWK